MGRFQSIFVPHWSYQEMKEAFGFSYQQYAFFGGYPGAAALVGNEREWREYINLSIVEPILSQDILMLTVVDKPALLRQVADLSMLYSGQLLSFNKMQGQLQDAGNITTIANYLELLDEACVASGLQNYSHGLLSGRTSSLKLQTYCNAFVSARIGKSFEKARSDAALWGRLIESSIGAAIVSYARRNGMKAMYWRHNSHEVDFVLDTGSRIVGIEVKSGHAKQLSGLAAFRKEYPEAETVVVSEDDGLGIPPEEFSKNLEWYLRP